ncbi:MAG: hypothetical protein ACSHW0_14440 [Thalassotalea sp.]
MDPKISCSGLALVLFLLTGCNSGVANKDESADPVLVEYPVVYIERDIYINADDEPLEMASFSLTDPTRFNPGANLFLKSNAFAESQAINLTQAIFSSADLTTESESDPRIDIRDLSVSADGQQFLISIRAPQITNADDDEQPSWNIWHYNHAVKKLARLMVDDTQAEQGDDLMASFLPDGRIIFASNRQRLSKAILLDEGKSQYQGQNERQRSGVFNLHIMQADGSSIKQLTYNLSHDFYPLVLQNGKILYSRWDAMGGVNKINLYQMLPDGTENQLVYGWHSHQLTVNEQNENINVNINFVKPQQLPNGDILLMLSADNDSGYQKRPMIINITDFIDENQAIANNTAVSDSAVSILFTEQAFNYSFSEQLNPAGRLTYLYPLPDHSKRYLLSLDLCRVIIDERLLACSQLTDAQRGDENLTAADPAYELWLYNQLENTQKLVARPNAVDQIITEAAILQPSDITVEFIADKIVGNELDTELYNQQSAALHIRSVYDIGGVDTSTRGITALKDPTQTTAAERPARFIRVLRGVPMPSNDVRQVANTDFGRSNQQLMREIIGYSPIQPDGSVKIKVPANVPLALSVLDQNGKRIGGRHRQWITIKAGETLECHGCHTNNNTMPHGRIDAEPASINSGAVSGGMPFPNTSSAIIPDAGQTMAEAAEQSFGLAELSSDLFYQDIWSDSEQSTLNPSIALLYSKLATPIPNGGTCFDNWSAYCRIQINYLEHIAPLWQLERQVVDVLSNELIQDNTCVSCHQAYDIDNLAQVPAGQLDLSAIPSEQPAHIVSYRELFFNDVEQAVVDGILTNRLIEVTDNQGNIVFEVDSEGELILDEDGLPIPQLTTVPVTPVMSPNGARASNRFFEVFERLDHQDMLSATEIKLLSEWLDIGGQYYNTPFYQQP